MNLPPWPGDRPLRAWQRAAAAAVFSHPTDAFLASASPAAGGTTFGLYVAHRMLAEGRVARVAVVAPTTHIARQWAADAAHHMGDEATWSGCRTAAAARPASRSACRRPRRRAGCAPRWIPTATGSRTSCATPCCGSSGSAPAHPAAGGLVVAADKEHAEALAERLAVVAGERPEIVTSDASARIARFAAGSGSWLVSVLMVSEGVDIPRLRVGVYATSARTELFFRQVVGHFIRRTPAPREQMSHVFLPADPALKRLAAQVEEERRHALALEPRAEPLKEIVERLRSEAGDAFRALWSSAHGEAETLQTTQPGETLALFAADSRPAAATARPGGGVGGPARAGQRAARARGRAARLTGWCGDAHAGRLGTMPMTRAILDAVASARRRSALHGWRLGLCAALVGWAVLLRGSIGVLLAIMALLVVLDSVIPVPRLPWAEADDRFGRLVRERRHSRRMRWLRGRGPERLEIFDDRDGWASVAPRRALGVQPIPIDSITGTVETSKAMLFDRSFRPDSSSSERWRSLWMAYARGEPLPPISVYRVGGEHILCDGHHRVSVVRDHGAPTIDAEVVELVRPGPPAGR